MFCFLKVIVFISVVMFWSRHHWWGLFHSSILLVCFNGALSLLLQLLLEKSSSVAACGWDAWSWQSLNSHLIAGLCGAHWIHSFCLCIYCAAFDIPRAEKWCEPFLPLLLLPLAPAPRHWHGVGCGVVRLTASAPLEGKWKTDSLKL